MSSHPSTQTATPNRNSRGLRRLDQLRIMRVLSPTDTIHSANHDEVPICKLVASATEHQP
eukprot:883058-Amphidinium_carterae.1